MVEDEELLREAMGPLLEEQGHDVAFAGDGRDALVWLRTQPAPDVIVLDLRMPVMNGWEFRVIQKDDPELGDIPVIAISADGSAQAAAISARAYLHKPVTSESLLDAIEEILCQRDRKASSPSEETKRFAYLKRLVASAGHEINNPLTLVMLNLDQSLEELHPTIGALIAPSDAPPSGPALEDLEARLTGVAEMLEECQVGAERIRETVGNLQQLSYQGEAPSAALDLHRLIEQSITESWARLRRRVRVTKAFGVIRPIFGDAAALRQVLRTLLLTCAQSLPDENPDRNEIRVATSVVAGDQGPELMVAISEVGNYLAPHIAVELLSPSLAIWQFGEDTGRNLAISQHTVARHHGRITVESVRGEGRVFRLFLAIGDRPEGHKPIAHAPPAEVVVVGKRMLVIEDESQIAHLIRRVLRDEYDVTLVTRASEALVLLDEGVTFDLVLCDVEMPGLTGPTFYAAVRDRWPHLLTRLVFMTGGDSSPGAINFVGRGAPKVLSKPFTAKRLRRFVRESALRDDKH